MKLYVVKNDSGEYWDYDDERWNTSAAGDYANSKAGAEDAACRHGGHVVKLVEKPELVEVNEKEAEKLREAKASSNPMNVIWWASSARVNDTDAQNRLMRAYVNGYTVRKSKRWNVPVPHTDGFFYRRAGERLYPVSKLNNGDAIQQFTDAEIEHYGLTDCGKVEVKD